MTSDLPVEGAGQTDYLQWGSIKHRIICEYFSALLGAVSYYTAYRLVLRQKPQEKIPL